MTKKNAIFIISGNGRTFIDCFDSCYTNVISKLFLENEYTIFVYFYLKLTDPGPKGQAGWNFLYKDLDRNIVMDKINSIKEQHKELHIDYKLLSDNEIPDDELLSQVKDRSKYFNLLARDDFFLRALHHHYNFECCGKYILEKEELMNAKFDYIIYIRPDLYFTNACNSIDTYNNSVVILGEGPNACNNDHIALIPREHLPSFFFGRMILYRTNTTHIFEVSEQVYWHTIHYDVKPMGHYYIKRS